MTEANREQHIAQALGHYSQQAGQKDTMRVPYVAACYSKWSSYLSTFLFLTLRASESLPRWQNTHRPR